LPINQGEIFDILGTPWIVVDNFHNNIGGYDIIHCAPILKTPELRLELDVSVAFEGGFVSLGLMTKKPKTTLRHPVGRVYRQEMAEIRTNLVTWFSVYSFDFDTVRRLPAPPEQGPSIYPGMIFRLSTGLVCVVDHWGCFNDYPLLYIAPVVPDLINPCPLDVEISPEFQDLFSNHYYVRTDDFFLASREEIDITRNPQTPMLGYGLLHKTTTALILKFGQLSLLL
jgi:hypothetical protein